MRVLVALCLISSFIGCGRLDAEDILKMAAFGNSISRGTNSIGFGNYPAYNWATGTKIESHMIKLEKQRRVQVIAKNLSIAGVTSTHLAKEIEHLYGFIPDYATIEIGANDVCRNMNTDILRNVKNAIDKLVKINPAIEIILVPIIKITSVHDVKQGLKCEIAWDLECPALLGTLVSDEQRLLRQLKLDGINYSLEKLAALYPQVSFNSEVGEVDVQEEAISDVDCFHPSVAGQQWLSDLTFLN